MQFSKRPSPALAVAFLALLVALGGTAVAAKVLITSSAQIKNGTITGADLKKGTITRKQIARKVLNRVGGSSTPAPAGATILEARKQYGPEVGGGEAKILELQLPAGAYAIFAKTTIAPTIPNRGLLYDVLKEGQTYGANCTLDVGGSGDFGIAELASQGSAYPATVNVQATRTLAAPTTATFTCKTDEITWRAENTSIIAVPASSISLNGQ